jgi:HK97 gp10 family phage protein
MPVSDVEIKGLLETQRKLEQTVRDLRGSEFLQGMRNAVLLVERDAKINAPVDTGRLRASITPEIRQSGTMTTGVVGSNVIYAAAQEFGTPHMVGKFYLQRALDSNQPRIVTLVGDAVGKIVER